MGVSIMRPTREATFMEIANVLAERSTCIRAKVGVVIVRDNRIISTGYAGSPKGMPHCEDVGCVPGPDGGCIRTVHAEANAIAFAAKHGVALDKATMYTTLAPCYACAKLIINAGITVVVYGEPYRDTNGVDILRERKVNVVQWP